MAEEKPLDFGQMLAGDPEFVRLQQKKAMARALQESVLKAQGGSFNKNPIAVGLDYLTLRGAKNNIQSVTDQEAAMFRAQKEQEAQGVRELTEALASGDPKMAIIKAMSSPYPNLKSLGSTLWKERGERFGKTVEAGKDYIDWPSVLASGGDPTTIKPRPPLAPPQVMSSPGGGPRWVQTQNQKGEYGVHFPPVPAIGSLTVGEKKPGWEAVEGVAKHWSAGGKGFEAGEKVQAQLNSTSEILRTLNENPQMGAGASAFQALRKWAETFGGPPLQLTGDTEQMKMQLGARVITELGGLGNQVSNADVTFINKALGELETDPAALRRLLLVAMKYQMKGLTKMRDQARMIAENPSIAHTGLQFPGFDFNVELPTNMDADDLNILFKNKLPPLRKGVTPPNLGLPPGVRRVPQ